MQVAATPKLLIVKKLDKIVKILDTSTAGSPAPGGEKNCLDLLLKCDCPQEEEIDTPASGSQVRKFTSSEVK